MRAHCHGRENEVLLNRAYYLQITNTANMIALFCELGLYFEIGHT